MRDGRDRRSTPRARTRLRPGKLLEMDGRFLADCAILDRSTQGVRIRRFGDVVVPARFRLLDESDGSTVPASQVWSSAGSSGLRKDGPAEALARPALLVVAGPYYAVR